MGRENIVQLLLTRVLLFDLKFMPCRLIEPKAVVYECGPNCGCGPGCVNRISQRGLKYRLEVLYCDCLQTVQLSEKYGDYTFVKRVLRFVCVQVILPLSQWVVYKWDRGLGMHFNSLIKYSLINYINFFSLPNIN